MQMDGREAHRELECLNEKEREQAPQVGQTTQVEEQTQTEEDLCKILEEREEQRKLRSQPHTPSIPDGGLYEWST